jgi:hypothetical protein
VSQDMTQPDVLMACRFPLKTLFGLSTRCELWLSKPSFGPMPAW